MAISLNTNLSSMTILSSISTSSTNLATALEQLSSGSKINSASDDPAGVIITTSLASALASLNQAVENNQESSNVLSIATGSLSEVSTLLTSLRSLAVEALNSGVTGDSEIEALQTQLDSGLSAISVLANTTSYSDMNLLDGSQEINASIDAVSGDQTQYTAASLSSSGSVVDSDGNLTIDQSFTVSGATGSQSFNYAAGISLEDVVTDINSYSDSTGVTATLSDDGQSVTLSSTDLGSSSSISVFQNSGDIFAAAGDTVIASGEDLLVDADELETMLNLDTSTITSLESTDMTVDIRFSGDKDDQAEKAYVESSFGGGETITEDQSFTITGVDGEKSFDFTAGTSISEIADAINESTESTGVTAYVINDGTEIRLVSEDYGSDQTVSVEQEDGDGFAEEGDTVSDTGQDLTVIINGNEVTGDGLTVKYSDTEISGTFDFNVGTESTDTSSALTSVAQLDYSADTLTDATTARVEELGDFSGGMQLQIGTSSSSSDSQVIGISSMDLDSLGTITVDGETYSLEDLFSGGAASLAENPELALAVIDQAIDDVSALSAQLGAYQSYTLEATNDAFEEAIININSAYSTINDTDIAAATTEYTKNQILNELGIDLLADSNEMFSNTVTTLLSSI